MLGGECLPHTSCFIFFSSLFGHCKLTFTSDFSCTLTQQQSQTCPYRPAVNPP